MRTRALELNSASSIWNPNRVLQVLDLMAEIDYNTLVIHDVPIMEELVWPSRYFGVDVEEGVHRRYREGYRSYYKYNPRRRPTPAHNIDYFRWVARRTHERGMRLYLNNKELYFPDAVLEFNPHLVKEGHICPSEPFWEEFVETKYNELFADFPELDGTITAPGTGESRLAITSSRCTCELCRQITPEEWYDRVVGAMYRAATRYGKQLVIRDFVFDRKAQDGLAKAMVDLPRDVVVCLKNTPHDYYPTFPDNPRIGEVGPHEQWIEFDALGQYFGWGISPAIMTEDLRKRLAFGRSKGADGLLVRIDWEALQGYSALRSNNRLNVYAASLVGVNPEITNEEIYGRWARAEGVLRADLGPDSHGDALRWLEEVFEETWPITSRTCFVRDCVFSDSTYTPVSIEHAFWLAEDKNSLRDWDPSKEGILRPTVENIRIVLAEKQEAKERVEHLLEKVEAGHPGVDARWHGDLVRRMRAFVQYVHQFDAVARAIFCSRHVAEAGAGADPALRDEALAAVRDLEGLAGRFRSTTEFDVYPVMQLLNADRLDALREDVEATLAAAQRIAV